MNAELQRQIARYRAVRARIHGGHVVEPPAPKHARASDFGIVRPVRPRAAGDPRDHWLARTFDAPHDSHFRDHARVLRVREQGARCADVVAAVGDVTGAAPTDLCGHPARHLSPQARAARVSPHCAARRAAIYLAAVLTALSLSEIARRFGAGDHTSVIYVRDRLRRARGADPQHDAVVDAALDRLGLPRDSA